MLRHLVTAGADAVSLSYRRGALLRTRGDITSLLVMMAVAGAPRALDIDVPPVGEGESSLRSGLAAQV